MTAAGTNEIAALLESVRIKVENYTNERVTLTQSLRKIVADAQGLLRQLGESPEESSHGRRRGTVASRATNGAAAKRTRNLDSGKRKMSKQGRARIAAAQRRRWAKFRAEKK